MSIVRYDPFRELDRLQSDMNRLFEGANAPTGDRTPSGTAPAPRWSPAVDVVETPTEIVLHAELPGIKPEAVDLELTGDTLTLRGERSFAAEERKDSYVRVERSYGRFQRQFTLTVPVDADAVKASYKDGVLEVRLPKSQANKPRKVQVVAHGSDTAQVAATPTAPVAETQNAGTEGTGEGSPS